jgi:hypothetical protein
LLWPVFDLHPAALDLPLLGWYRLARYRKKPIWKWEAEDAGRLGAVDVSNHGRRHRCRTEAR